MTQQQHFPRHSMVTWNDNEYKVLEVQRRTDGTWSLIEPSDPHLMTKWVPCFELKALEIPAPHKNFEEKAAARLERWNAMLAEQQKREVIVAILAAQGIQRLAGNVTPEALDILDRYGKAQP